MTVIREYVLGIIAIVLFSVLLEMMMPSGNFKKYIKLVGGLLVMFVLIQPIVKLPALEDTLATFGVTTQTFLSQSDDIQKQVETAQEAQISQHFSGSLEHTIQDGIMTAFGQSSTVSVSFDGETVTSVSIVVPGQTAEIEQFVKNNYGLNATVTTGGN